MCGIIGYIGDKNFIEISKKCLSKLEYRGYDSAGIAFFDGESIAKENQLNTSKLRKKNKALNECANNMVNRIIVHKEVGNVENLFNSIKSQKISHCGIGHTRWATNGKPTKINAHPHKSQGGEFYVVHNGVIENTEQIKQKYLKDVKFESDTDTEIIPNLIANFYKDTKDSAKAIQKTMQIMKGSFSFITLNINEPDRIYYAKYKSPLLIGKGKNENFISSDIQGFDENVNEYINLDDMQFGYVTKSAIYIFDENFKKIGLKSQKIRKKSEKTAKNQFKHFMLKEIYDIPNTILNTIKIYSNTKNPFQNFSKNYFDDIKNFVLIACGTSYHSALIGEKYIKEFTNYTATTHIASEFLYSNEKIDQKSIYIFISQSGETADVLSAINKVKKLGAKTIGITNVLNSNICSLCDYILPLNAGPEIAVASTKAYISQISVLLLFSIFLSKNRKKMQFYMKKLEFFAKNLDIEKIISFIDSITNELTKAQNIYLIGRNYDYITCLEAALKIKEITYIPSFAMPAGELKHGTLALISNNTPVIAVITEKNLIEKTMMITEQVKARGGKVYIFSQFNLDNYDLKQYEYFKIPTFDEFLMPLVAIIPFQLISYNMAVLLGYNPDKPRNLAKSVTVE